MCLRARLGTTSAVTDGKYRRFTTKGERAVVIGLIRVAPKKNANPEGLAFLYGFGAG
jgi:hypothetical protein